MLLAFLYLHEANDSHQHHVTRSFDNVVLYVHICNYGDMTFDMNVLHLQHGDHDVIFC